MADAPDIHPVVQAKRTAVLVVAMHRSGTSALSRTLNLLGCDTSPNQMPADEYNASGYWESRPIYELNEKILSSGGAGWADWMEFNPNWFRSSAMDRYRERAEACIEAEFGKSNLFVIKDPRLSLLMPFWRTVFEGQGIEPVVIHTLRNPVEVGRSLERRNKFLMSKGILLWLRYTLEGERGTRGLRRFFTTYDDLMDDYVGFIERSQENLGLFWPRNSDKLRRELSTFLADGLRHHKEAGKSLRSLSYAAKWVETTYDVLKDFAANGENDAGRAVLDAVHAEFTAAGHALGSIVKENDERFAHIGQLKQEHEESEARKAELEQAVAQAKSQQDAVKVERAAVEAKAAAALQRSEALQKEKAAVEDQHRATQKEREELRQKTQALESAVAQARQQRDEIKAAQAEIEARAVKAQEQADAIQRAKTALEQRHLATQKERDGLREVRAQLEAEQAAAAKERDDLQDRASSLDEALAGAVKEQEALKAAQAGIAAEAKAAQERADAIQRAKTALEERHLATQKERDGLREMKAQLEEKHLATQQERDTLRGLREKLEAEQAVAVQEQAALLAEKQALETAAVDADRAQATLADEKARLQGELDMRDEAIGTLTRDLQDRDAALAVRDRDLASLTVVLADTERTSGDHQIKAVQTEQLAQQWETESQRLAAELQAVREAGEAELSALQHALAQTESALRQRQLESEQTGEELIAMQRQARVEREAYETAKAVFDQKLEEERFRASSMERGRAAAEQEIQRRFDEIASVTEQLVGREADLAVARDEMAGIAEQLVGREAELAAIRHEMAGLVEQLMGREAELVSSRDGLESLTALLAARDAELVEAGRALADVRQRAGEHEQEIHRLRHEMDVAEGRMRENLAQSGASERRFVETMRDFTAVLQDKDARLVQLEQQHGIALQSVETAREGARQQRDMLQAMMIASREDVEARRNDAMGTRQAGEQIYQQFLVTLRAMLAQAVLPFPALTRRKTIERQRRILEDHAGFDPAWYIAAHEDLRDSGVDPYRHYIRHGVAEGRAPNATMEALRARMSPDRN
ncbi:hypothetical protein DM806_00865 [Sphingobium lactosutens]|uniref:hypothetical protein n=1 Tax=Sphingobium lactosutens TaxID=522773 RepID=UPI0015BE11C7|nr:hypothetical protein [Sphingobium lactosutens]NWK94270.1 hypothetical protein [Sphingobium lactosutens]